MTDQRDPWTALENANPGWAERILEAHQPDGYKNCRACSGQLSSVKHPCVLRFHAVEAIKVRGNRPRNAA
jgi:hypothetical protein